MYGPCRSSIGGGQALTPPSRRRLGGPLPRQLADSPQASPRANLSDLPLPFLKLDFIFTKFIYSKLFFSNIFKL